MGSTLKGRICSKLSKVFSLGVDPIEKGSRNVIIHLRIITVRSVKI